MGLFKRILVLILPIFLISFYISLNFLTISCQPTTGVGYQEEGGEGEGEGEGEKEFGQACWDLNNNGQVDIATEDTNGDKKVDIYDCRNSDEQPGLPGFNCWDTDQDRINDPEEDTNKDGQFTVADCQPLLNVNNCEKDKYGQNCQNISADPPCLKEADGCGVDYNTNPISQCKDGKIAPPEDIVDPNNSKKLSQKGCGFDCTQYRQDEGFPNCSDIGDDSKVEELVASYIKDSNKNQTKYDCVRNCDEEFCLDMIVNADPILLNTICKESATKIPAYYQKIHFKIRTCLQRWEHLYVTNSYLAWDTVAGFIELEDNQGNPIYVTINDEYDIASSRHCATDHGEGKYYQLAVVEMTYPVNGKEETESFDWFLPGLYSFNFTEILEEKTCHVFDYGKEYFVNFTNFDGPGVFKPTVVDSFQSNGQVLYGAQSIFWYDPVTAFEFDLYLSPYWMAGEKYNKDGCSSTKVKQPAVSF